MINNKLQFTFLCKIDFTYYLCNTVIFPSNVFIKSKKTKNSFQASIFIFKLGGVCNLFPHVFIFEFFFFFKSILWGSGRVLLTTWVRKEFSQLLKK